MNPLVSIIITCHNYQRYIVDCLLSCCNQDYDEVEIIVVDDASTDKSCEMIAKVRDSRIKAIRMRENAGYSTAKNTGILHSKGKYIRFLDADDCMTLVGVSKPVAYIEKNPCDLVHGIAYIVNGGTGYGKMLAKQEKYKFDQRCVVHAQGLLYPRATFEKYGLFYTKLRSKADKEHHMRLKVLGGDIRKIESKLAFYRVHSSSMLAMRNRNKAYDKDVTRIFNERMKDLKKRGFDAIEARL